MKKILIIGKNSYIGNSFIKWMERFPDEYLIDSISVRNDDWKDLSFESYDVIFHVAGIAHIKPKPEMEELFYKVNRDLTISLAEKALKSGVSQFIFLSSMNVFGDTNEIIKPNTQPVPRNFYGNSKLQADEGIQKLNSETFKVVSVRPPVVYGANCKGNFRKLASFSKVIPFFPDFNNKRSIIYIDNLCEFIRLIIDNYEQGVFHPQNKEIVSTTKIVETIAKIQGKKIITTKVFNPIICVLLNKINLINKIFADDLYDSSLSNYENYSYCVVDFEESIKSYEEG